MWDDDDFYGGYGSKNNNSTYYYNYNTPDFTKNKVKTARDIIRKFAWQYDLTPKAKKELDDAYADLKKAQDECSHYFETVTNFTSIIKCCAYCGIERSKD